MPLHSCGFRKHEFPNHTEVIFMVQIELSVSQYLPPFPAAEGTEGNYNMWLVELTMGTIQTELLGSNLDPAIC